jgi:hypothetical protein
MMKRLAIIKISTILKMNFNFNIKDMPGAAKASIDQRTIARVCYHTVGLWPRMVSGCMEAFGIHGEPMKGKRVSYTWAAGDFQEIGEPPSCPVGRETSRFCR